MTLKPMNHGLKARLRLALLACGLAGAAAMASASQTTPAVAQAESPQACPAPAAPLQADALDELQRTRPAAPDRGLLWQVDKDGRRGWLYGTMHLGRQPWLQLGPRLQQALAAADVLALEVDLTDPRTGQELAAASKARAAASQAQAGAGRGAHGHAADPAVAEGRQRRIAAQLQRVCLPATALAGAAAHMQAAALVVLSARGEGLYAEYGSERVLALLARRQGKRVVAVEDVRSQAGLLKRESAQADAQQLSEALDELESGRTMSQLRRLSELWAGGDADMLARYDEWCDCIHDDADREARHRLLTARNGPMADAFERLHGQGGTVLLAVGALHMVGPEGLVAELGRRGYRVTRVQAEGANSLIPAQP